MDIVELQAKFEEENQINDRQQRIIRESDKQATRAEDIRKESIQKEEIHQDIVKQEIQRQSPPLVTYNNSGNVNQSQQNLFSTVA